jgi:hypothetical protein
MEASSTVVRARIARISRRMARKRPFRIGRSRTGLGLFATEPIRKRTRIVEYKGRKLPNDEAEKLETRGNRYLYEINSRWTIDGSTRRNLGRYANRSCRPNVESYQVRHRGFLHRPTQWKVIAVVATNMPGATYLPIVASDGWTRTRIAGEGDDRAPARCGRRWVPVQSESCFPAFAQASYIAF